MILEQAAIIIQKIMRGYLSRKNFKVDFLRVSKSISNLRIQISHSLLFSDKPESKLLKLNPYEIMLTRVNVNGTNIELVSNQGTPDTMRKYLNSINVDSAAVINGGFYAINGFYDLKTDSPIGLHRFSCKHRTAGRNNKIQKDFDNTSQYFSHSDEAIGLEFEEYKGKDIESCIHLKTQCPYAYKDLYGLFRITHQGAVDIQKLSDFSEELPFKEYLADAKNLLSSGPLLVLDSQVVFTEDMLNQKRFQFEEVKKHFGTHPGSVPPGSFYHADQPNPRSAIGLASNGELMMVTLKGEEDPSNRDGMTLPQFAHLIQFLGAQTALNLDGGYSACQGVFNKSMFTPLFLKKAGRNTLIPCAIMAEEQPEAKLEVNPVTNNLHEQESSIVLHLVNK